MTTLSQGDKSYLKELVSEVSEHSTNKIVKTIDDRFTAYGFDIKTPVEIQKDMAFLGKMRKVVDSMVMRFIALIIAGISVVGLVIKFKSTKGE